MRSSQTFAPSKYYTVETKDFDGEECFLLTCHYPRAFKNQGIDDDIHPAFDQTRANTFQIELTKNSSEGMFARAKEAIATLKNSKEILDELARFKENLDNSPTKGFSS